MLSILDYPKIVKEIDSWIIEIPDVNALTLQNIAACYSRLVAYKLRVSSLLAEAKSWKETADTACKYLEDLSQGAFTGTGVEKKANAMNVIQPFVHLKVQASRIENYLDKIHSSILFCATQLDLLIKEKQSRAKLNNRLAHEGEFYSSDSQYSQDSNENNSFYKEEQEEDGETWTTVKKAYKLQNK
jgi:hypothetical protein